VRRLFPIFMLLVGLGVGIGVGPRVQALYWSAVLDHHPNKWTRWMAAVRLSESSIGNEILWQRARSSDPAARDLAITELANTERPWDLESLLAEILDSHTGERLDLLFAFNYAYFHARVIQDLRYELLTSKNPKVNAKIRSILQSFREADKELDVPWGLKRRPPDLNPEDKKWSRD
jgi:hypothetical protein